MPLRRATHRFAPPCLALLACVSVAACATSGPAQRADAETATVSLLTRQAEAWDRAIVRKDREAVATNMDAGFRQIDSDGGWHDKAGFLDGILDERLTIAPYTVEDLQVRVYGDTALLTGTTDLHGTWDGKPFRTHYRYTDVYVKRDGRWKVVNVQTTRIAE